MDERRTGSVVMIGLFSSLMLTGCSAEAEAPTSESAAAAISVLETSAGRYEFTPTTCAIYSQDDFDDIEIQGPGTTPDGEKFFFELSSTANAMTIGLGVDGPFASPERQLKAGRIASQEFTIVTSGRQLSVTDLMLVDENGASIDDRAALSIDCGVR
ncbi:hypothetical protein KUG47_16650 [Falsochrobactrum sp. TDYN1]|uniref:Lipoprotein n=1 Tax=Falsochrobactrum tianjinense TaxID=2706015 RepID=A0A949PPG1_9HYPH|nr:hypothetical protein [Falsochrobactrum sp. TDYN1]MBV2145116.1 hypothetical protein [Falsochrobactrum sp. TDYN1]